MKKKLEKNFEKKKKKKEIKDTVETIDDVVKGQEHLK